MTDREHRHWLFKSEPDVYGIERLEREGRTEWSGVRNAQARNFMREMRVGDEGFFYHSSVSPPGIAGICRVVREAYPDFTQFDPASEYYDRTAKRDVPRWYMVDVGFVRRFERLVPLDELRAMIDLEGMPLLRRGQRLSEQPVADHYWDAIMLHIDGTLKP
jgi:predicted RNA-binding protein with PUA-like domain